jgi:hypothetical protein
MITKFYRWYDTVREPYRLFIALGLAMLGIIPLSMGKGWLAFLGAIWLVFLLLTRFWFVKTPKKAEVVEKVDTQS